MDNFATTTAENEAGVSSPETTTPVHPVHNFAQLHARHDLQLQTTPLPFTHTYGMSTTPTISTFTRAMPALATPPQHTKSSPDG